MGDEKRTKEDLIKELTALRRRVVELEQMEASWKDTQLEISDRMGHYFTLVDQPNDALFVIFDRKFEFINHRFEELFGFSMDEVCNPDFNPIDLIAPESRRPTLEHIQKGYGGKFSSRQFEFAGLTKDGRKIECETTVLFIPYKWGIAVHGVLRNVTVRKRIDEELQRERSDLQLILNSIPTSIYYTDREHRFTQINEAFSKALGRQMDSIIGKTISEIFPNLPPHQVARCHEDNNHVISIGQSKRGIIEMYPSARGHRWVQTDKMPYRGDDGSVIGVISLSIDISEFRETEEKLWYLSFHDVLTGVYNRAYFEEELIRHEHSRLYPLSIVVIAVNNLKSVNTDRGIEAGNELLKRTSQILKAFRSEDIVARVGGNRFAAILPLSDESIGQNAILRLKKALSAQSQDYPDAPLLLSFGVATGRKGSNLSDLFKQAEEQISRSK